MVRSVQCMVQRVLMLTALLFVASTLSAQKGGKGKKSRTTVTAGRVNPQPSFSVQPVPADSFSYAMGLVQGPSLKQYLLGQDGLTEADLSAVIEGLTATMSDAEAQRIIAVAAGLQVARTNRERMLPMINEQITGKQDSAYVVPEIYTLGLADALLGKSGMLPVDSAQKIVERQTTYAKERYRFENETWLATNRTKTGIVSTASGLQYKVLTQGTGAIPSDSATVEVHYEGSLISGKVFDSSYKRGNTATFPVKGVIRGWTEALQLMPEGSVWELYIPSELAYGERGTGRDIPPYSTLIFKVELVRADASKDK